MKTKLLTFFFLSILAISQLSFINSKNTSLITKEVDNPYAPYSDEATTYSGKTFDIVDDNNNRATINADGTAIAYFQIIDNSNNDFFNYITNSNGYISEFNYYIGNNSSLSRSCFYYPSLSNIKNNDVYYMTFESDNKARYIRKFSTLGNFATLEPDAEMVGGLSNWSVLNNTENFTTTNFNHYQATDIYPYIIPYSDENTDVFETSDINEGGDLTFTIKVNNWTESTEVDYLTEEQNIGVTLVNEDESDEYLKYEQYEASLIDREGNYYTYKVEGLNPETNYTFYSINFTGISIGDTKYYPDFDIRLAEELGVPWGTTAITNMPYINPDVPDVFQITNVDAKSIEFSLKVVDSSDNKFLNHLENEDNTMDVTLKNLDTIQTIQTEATFVSEDNDVFTFKITGLDSNTNYQFISLDNTGLAVNDELDDRIFIDEDLGVYDNNFITASNSTFYILISISVLILIIVIIFTFLTSFKKRNNEKKISGKMSSSS